MNYSKYKSLMIDALNSVEDTSVEQLYQYVLRNSYKGIFIFGNGGSAAIANHWVCDAAKGIGEDTHIECKITSLSTNIPLITAIANDIGYEFIFSKQLEYMMPTLGLAIAVSSSGNSRNIIEGLKTAKSMGLYTVAMTGFTGGEAATIADISVHVNSDNYGVIEDCHMSILHSISQRIRVAYSFDKKTPRL